MKWLLIMLVILLSSCTKKTMKCHSYYDSWVNACIKQKGNSLTSSDKCHSMAEKRFCQMVEVK